MAIELICDPHTLLLAFLRSVIETQVRAVVADLPTPSLPTKAGGRSLAQQWLLALGTPTGELRLETQTLCPLQTVLTTWIAPLQTNQHHQFRACFVLHPPPTDVGGEPIR
ncbi:hypothetical protein [Neosynechococcus sphagnicola]|uniref:hypothetical protein n=1 Tax=Neosynechococcus sphagnicola TaxID=1501145 RepID=UPI001EFA01AB|nr:hypothetical protein [Neosynechococcus sphagnicola]